jgi:hypothetical protein
VSGASGSSMTGTYQWGSGGGSGGSVFITTGTLQPSYGTLRSNGGDGAVGWNGQHGTAASTATAAVRGPTLG